MATLRRTHPPLKQSRSVSGSKRPRSPDQSIEVVPKRLKAAPPVTAHREKEVDKEKARRHAEREQQRIEFKEKYRRAFPGWKFYFDTDNIRPDDVSAVKLAQAKIRQLGGSIENFFSNNITHLITDQPAPSEPPPIPSANKENDIPRNRLKSPIKLKGPAADDIAPPADLVSKAKSFENTKVWSISKLQSVVDRCLDAVPAASTAATSTTAPAQRSLSHLLQSERLHGSSERDPTQKRHDYKYFGRGTYFMMVEDIREELATVAVQEYTIPKGRDVACTRVPWPVLYCHPQARSPFLPFDEREKKRWEKAQRLEVQEAGQRQEREKDKMLRVEAMKRKAEARLLAGNQSGDLRRSASMNNMHRRAQLLDEQALIDLDGDVADSANASGYFPGGYLAASGNSVGITSTTGTTSTAGLSFKTSMLPPSLRGRQEVLTSLKFLPAKAKGGDMGPPISVPERRPMLKKSRSTNTMRLPKRDEDSKPGYCECCRTKFDDFTKHITGRKHRKFAMDDANFLQLDYVLARVKRRTVEEMKQEELEWELKCSEPRSGDDDDHDDEEAVVQYTGATDYDMFEGALVDLDS
ncbi:Dfp1/Him1, central region-domain-containing protein [Mycena maculata]|uniref:Dfp1/Him1, central region-domain-containing protein n=1 Tax=Mycena maculata TaxID=230809 RepID=A0AAD7H612_9AGAR|nr:Dfp1/Him1, central region-domain-containing protein [Mycena maculata]